MPDRIMNISLKERELLLYIRKRPPMYIGEFSLSKLRTFFDGYNCALRNYDMKNKYCIIPKEFDDFVAKKYKIYPCNMGYAWIILQHMSDGKEAIERFFQLLDEFLEANGFGKI